MESAVAHSGLMERLERESRESPRLYKFKLAALASLGFLVLGGAAVLGVGLSAGLVIGLWLISPVLLLKLIKIIWIPIAFGWFVLKALWVKFDPPEGYRLRPGEAPALEAEVERIRKATGAPRLDGIVIDADLNAAAATVPRALGLLGQRHYLVLGLPLMQLLDRDQLAAVIAHEFGHFGGGHSRFAGWIYHVRVSWARVLGALSENGGKIAGVFTRFFNWYSPYFNRYSFALARANEYQADAAAAKVAGAQAAGNALVRVHLGSEQIACDFWPSITQAYRNLPAPPASVYGQLAAHLRTATPADHERLTSALALAGGFEDTHPTLAQRLGALGVEATAPGPVEVSAADELLGGLQGALVERFSSDWHRSVEDRWAASHRQHVEDVTTLEALEAREGLSDEESVEYARLVEELRPEADALPLWRVAAERAPDNPLAQFRLGSLLLDQEDASGVDAIRRAMSLDSGAVEPGCYRMANFYEAAGDSERRDAIVAELNRYYAEQAATHRERGRVNASDTYLPHGLDADALENVKRQLDAFGGVRKAWLVRKHVSNDPAAVPHFVLLVTWKGLVFSEGGRLQKLVDALDLPGTYIAITAPNQRRIASRVKKAAGAVTYRR